MNERLEVKIKFEKTDTMVYSPLISVKNIEFDTDLELIKRLLNTMIEMDKEEVNKRLGH